MEDQLTALSLPFVIPQELACKETPFLLMNLNLVKDNYHAFQEVFTNADCFYSVKANNSIEVIEILADLGCKFEVASMGEIEICLGLGVPANRLFYSNTIKKPKDIVKAYKLGIRLFAFDCMMELDKLNQHAPDAELICRLVDEGKGSLLPLSHKFGCIKEVAFTLIARAIARAQKPVGVTFHVGSQQEKPDAWEKNIKVAAEIFDHFAKQGHPLSILDIGGGFPVDYGHTIPDLVKIHTHVRDAIDRYFTDSKPKLMIEPGRAMVANAGVIVSEVVLISPGHERIKEHWVYLDVGCFNGLFDVQIQSFPVLTDKDEAPKIDVILAGPTCDSEDIFMNKTAYRLPNTLALGDKVYILTTGAYSSVLSTVSFNGFKPLETYFIR